jgi:hypothetical protein
LLNDEGFSSYRTERTVVPKSGTAEFVIFIRSDQFGQGWWTQGCADNIIIQSNTGLTEQSDKQIAKCIGQFNLLDPDPKCLVSPEISVDLDTARRVCIHYYKSPANRSKQVCDGSARHGQNCEPSLIEIGTDDELNDGLAYFKPKTVIYKHWMPISIAVFRELTLAVVAGTHIQEATDATATLAKIDCPTDDKGDVDFDKADNGSLTCTLTGTNLDKVQTLKLRNSADATDTKTASGTVTTTTSNSSKVTKASFTLDSLGALPAKLYKVSTVTQDGVETPGNQVVHLSAEPYIPATGKPDPNSVNLAELVGANAKPVPIALKGFHLDDLQSVRFAKAADDKSPASVTPFDVSVDQGATVSQAQVTITAEDVKKAKISGDFATQKLELSISLLSKDAPNTPIATKQVLYGTGNITATPGLTIKLSVNAGPVDTPVTITGTNFGATQGNSTVTFNGTKGTPTKWSASSIVVPVPSGAKTGNVVVTVDGVASKGVKFTIP